MPKKTKRRYAADPLAHERTTRRCAPLTGEQATDIILAIHLAWDALRKGTATHMDFDLLCGAVNTTGIALEGAGQEVFDVMRAGAMALLQVKERYHRTKRLGVDATALRDIPPALDLHDQLLSGQMVTLAQIARCADEAAKRLARGQTLKA